MTLDSHAQVAGIDWSQSPLVRKGVAMNVARVGITLAVGCSLVIVASRPAFAQLAANQTNGFGNDRLVTFTYLQNFDCVDQPNMDLDFNTKPAASDPHEMQMPICQVVTEPTADPSGGDIKHTAHLYVFVPMFSIGQSQAA